MAYNQTVSFDKIKHKKKMATEDIIFTILNTTFLVLFAVVTLYPVLNTLAYSFNEGNDAVMDHILENSTRYSYVSGSKRFAFIHPQP